MFSVCPSVKMSAADLDQAFREAVTSNGPDGGWTIKNDERVKYVGKLEVSKGEDTSLKVTMEDYPEAGMSALKYYTIQSCTPPPRSRSAALERLARTPGCRLCRLRRRCLAFLDDPLSAWLCALSTDLASQTPSRVVDAVERETRHAAGAPAD